MTEVRVDWQVGNYVPPWNEMWISILERFGLPGDKYETKLTDDHLIFQFKDFEDAVIAKLMIGG